jgi:hypothetical protein
VARQKGCGLCKPWKFDGLGDTERQGRVLQRELGVVKRGGRHDVPDEGVRRGRARKDRRRWCGGHPGREHEPVTVARSDGVHDRCEPAPAFWERLGHGTWRCIHRVVCARCGRVLDPAPDQAACPDYPGVKAAVS